MFNRVLIASASAGNGHVKAAEAVELAIRAANSNAEICNVDVLQYSSTLLRRSYSKGYIDMVNNMPEALGWMYDALDKPWKYERRRMAFHRLNTKPLSRRIRKFNPDLVVSTHFLPSELVSRKLCRGKLTCASAIVVTDLDAHAMWLCRHYDRFFVALDETKQHLAQLGIVPDNITVSGIPINPVFAVEKPKQEMRRQFGLDPHKTTILLSTGGLGVGPIEKVTESLLQLRQPAQILALCGKNEALKTRMTELAAQAAQTLKIVPVGYTNKVDEYMSASDLVLGKPGGLTTSEALAKGLAFVIVNPIPGQEERNSDHLLEENIAIRCNNLPVLAFKLDRLLSQPERIQVMQANARRLGRPRAAEEIASILASAPAAYGGTVTQPCPFCRKRTSV